MTLRCAIVDDNSDVLRAARLLLESQGITVVGVAATAKEALAVAREMRPDVMLVDIVIGEENGFDLARELARASAGAGPCSILISTRDQADYMDLIAASPAIGFLPKSDLSATAIHRLLARARAQGDGESRDG